MRQYLLWKNFVGDSENDIAVFKATGRGIAVHPFKEQLESLAWKKIDSLEQIKKIL